MSLKEMFKDKTMFYSCYVNVHQLPSTLSNSLVEVNVTSDQIKCIITLKEMIDLFGFEH